MDVIALVRHAFDPATPLCAHRHDHRGALSAVAGRSSSRGRSLQRDQRRWLDAVKDHIANNLSIDQDDFETCRSTSRWAGSRLRTLRRQAQAILDDLNARLAA